jgi:hypothetical protein
MAQEVNGDFSFGKKKMHENFKNHFEVSQQGQNSGK